MGPVMRTRRALPPVILDLDDVEHIAFARGLRYARNPRTKVLNALMLPALYFGERKAIRMAERTLVCSDNDLDYLTKRLKLKGVVKIPNAVAIAQPQQLTSDQTLLFLGSYSHKPNIDAAQFLIKKIWPLIHQAMPGAKLVVAGAPPERIPCFADAGPGVSFPGFVENLDLLYQSARIVCAPILSGSGTRVKILEACAYGKPVVSTLIGAEGLQLKDGQEILIRDDPREFADACIGLLTDASLGQKIGSAARTRMQSQYELSSIQRTIQETVHELLMSQRVSNF